MQGLRSDSTNLWGTLKWEKGWSLLGLCREISTRCRAEQQAAAGSSTGACEEREEAAGRPHFSCPAAPCGPRASHGPTAPHDPMAPHGPTAPPDPMAPHGPTAPHDPMAPCGPIAPHVTTSPPVPTTRHDPTVPDGPKSSLWTCIFLMP